MARVFFYQHMSRKKVTVGPAVFSEVAILAVAKRALRATRPQPRVEPVRGSGEAGATPNRDDTENISTTNVPGRRSGDAGAMRNRGEAKEQDGQLRRDAETQREAEAGDGARERGHDRSEHGEGSDSVSGKSEAAALLFAATDLGDSVGQIGGSDGVLGAERLADWRSPTANQSTQLPW